MEAPPRHLEQQPAAGHAEVVGRAFAVRWRSSAMIGERVAHYQILEQLGRGGMGIVYRADRSQAGTASRAEVPARGHGLTSGALDRFTREARSAAALNHPHICTIYEIGEHDGRPFIAMELLEGHTLADQIGGRPLPIGHVDRSRAADRERARCGARQRHRPPRHQASQHLRHRVGHREDPRLRPGEVGRATGAPAGSPDGATTADEGNLTGRRVDARHGRLHVARAGARPGARRPQRHLLARPRALRDGDRPPGVRRRDYRGCLRRHPEPDATGAFRLNSDVPPELERIIAKAIDKERDGAISTRRISRPICAASTHDRVEWCRRGGEAGDRRSSTPWPSVATPGVRRS